MEVVVGTPSILERTSGVLGFYKQIIEVEKKCIYHHYCIVELLIV